MYIELNPGAQASISLRNAMALKRLELASREERAALYGMAIRQGKARVPGGDFLDRIIALGIAALDGLEEFAPFIEKYAMEINRARPDENAYAEILLWTVRLRAGAANRTDAMNRHVERLKDMGDEEFRERMEGDRAFQGSTLALARAVCPRGVVEEACRKLAALTVRQKELQKGVGQRPDEGRPTGASSAASPDGPSWLTRLSGITEGGQAVNEFERQEKRRQAAEAN